MKPIAKIKQYGLTKFNNAEYVNFATRFLELIKNAGTLEEPESTSALGIESEDIAQYEQDLQTMNDIVAQSRISDYTETLTAIDRERDRLVVYLMNFVRSSKLAPIGTTKKTATSLYNVLKPYVGCQRLPNQQKTVQINGLLTDVKKEDPASYITLLGLDDVIEILEEKNSEYAQLTSRRTDELSASRLEVSKTVRDRMDEYYDYMTTIAFVQSVAAPTEATANFIRLLNAMIDELSALHSKRVAQSKRNKEETL